MHLGDIIGNLKSNQIGWNFWFLTQTSFRATIYSFDFFTDGLQIIQIRSTNFSLDFEGVKIHKHCLYWNVFSTDI